MKKEIEFVNICDRIAAIFFELSDIVAEIRSNFDVEHVQDPNLTLEIIDYSFDMVSSRARSFLAYKNRQKKDWSLEKYIQYAKDNSLYFFREFDNPFLRSRRWASRIAELLTRLSAESRELEGLLKNDE